MSSKFDIIGLYYTSSQGFDSTFTMACLQNALLHFEMFNFHVLALIGDGASWNQTLSSVSVAMLESSVQLKERMTISATMCQHPSQIRTLELEYGV